MYQLKEISISSFALDTDKHLDIITNNERIVYVNNISIKIKHNYKFFFPVLVKIHNDKFKNIIHMQTIFIFYFYRYYDVFINAK